MARADKQVIQRWWLASRKGGREALPLAIVVSASMRRDLMTCALISVAMRYNALGLEGLSDRPRRNGPRPRLSGEQEAQVAEWIAQEKVGRTRWRIMTRTGFALFLLFATAGAGPTPSLPVPPVPPVHPPLGQSAPIPNPDTRAPQYAGSGRPNVSITDFRFSRQDQSLGYSPGSQFQSDVDRHGIQTPGLAVRVPLQ
jgi:hypothetical protein